MPAKETPVDGPRNAVGLVKDASGVPTSLSCQTPLSGGVVERSTFQNAPLRSGLKISTHMVSHVSSSGNGLALTGTSYGSPGHPKDL